jgi:cytochrome P450
MATYNPNDPAVMNDPYPTYASLRDEQPLYHNPDLDFWALSRHADVSAAWRKTKTYSSDHGPALEEFGPDASRVMGFVAMDPPQHTVMRRLIASGFTRDRIIELEPRIRQLTRKYLRPALEQGSFDFVGDFASMIPVDVISELIGVPENDRPMLLRLSQQIMTRDDIQGRLTPAVAQANLELAGYYGDLIAEREREPRDDLVSALLHAEIEGRRLSTAEVIATLMLLGVAGNETTIRALGTAWRCAWQHPEQRERVWSGEIEIGAWVEETLRYEGPSQYTARRVTAPLELYGTVVPANACMLLVIAAANRDGRVFIDADRFDMTRDTREMLAFGLGPHFCLGALLARLELKIVLEELVRTVHVDYDVDMARACWTTSPSVRGHAQLPTTIKAR